MGATISITNKTDLYINVAVKQVGVLYWKNGLGPGETVTWQLGRVWVTAEAIVDDLADGRTQYRELDRVLPIVLVTGGALAVAGSAVVAAGPVLLGTGAAVAAAATAGGTAATAAHASAATAGLAAAGTAAHTASVAATAGITEGLVSSGTASAAGAAIGAAIGAFGKEVAGAFGRKAVGTATDIAVDATVGSLTLRQRQMPHLVKARKYGVFTGKNPKLVVKGHRRAITIDYEVEPLSFSNIMYEYKKEEPQGELEKPDSKQNEKEFMKTDPEYEQKEPEDPVPKDPIQKLKPEEEENELKPCKEKQ